DAVGLNDAGDLTGFQRAWHFISLHGAYQTDMTLWCDCARCHRFLAIQVDRVGDATDVPELQHDTASSLVHGVSDALPSCDLLLGPYAGSTRVANSHGSD